MLPNNFMQRTHQSVTLFASQKPRLFTGPLNSGRWAVPERGHPPIANGLRRPNA